MVEAFRAKETPLFVAYYRRGLPRFLKVRELLQEGVLGTLSSVHIVQYGPLDTGEQALGWRYDPSVAGGGLFMDLGSHGLDLLDFLVGPIKAVGGFSVNTGGAYRGRGCDGGLFRVRAGKCGHGSLEFQCGPRRRSDHVHRVGRGTAVSGLFRYGDHA